MKIDFKGFFNGISDKFKYFNDNHGPEAKLIAGIAGLWGAAIGVGIATHKLEEKNKAKNEKLEKIYQAKDDGIIDEKEESKEIRKAYVKYGLDICKYYAAPLTSAVTGTLLILSSHNDMKKRYLALGAAYTTLDQSFRQYRDRVKEKLGEEEEKRLHYGIETKEITNEDGSKETIEYINPDILYGPFTYIFDESSEVYSKEYMANKTRLMALEAWATNKLVADGYLYLNTVLSELDIPIDTRTSAGWVYDKHDPGKNIVDFGLFRLNSSAKMAFINGTERSIILEFNCMPDISAHVPQSNKLVRG